MRHLNGNILCAIDVETTGLQPYFHDLIQICVLPLNSELRPLEGTIPFYTEVVPKRPYNFDPKASSVNKLDACRIQTQGLDADRAADLFDEWFNKLGLPFNKQISPLAHNWPFDLQFITDWLGWHNVQRYFSGHYRDLMMAGLYENDKADFNSHPYPYPKHRLSYYCSQLKVTNPNAHDALGDCVATAECYRRVVKAGLYTPVAPQLD